MGGMSTVLPAFPPRTGALAVLLGSAATLGGAFIFQYGVGLAPCVLCIWQRWPHAIAIMLTLTAVVIAGRSARTGAALLAGAGIALLAGAGIAAFHVGVEYGWWAGTAECGGTTGAITLDDLRAQILAAPVVRCDEVAWSLFGISMAGYNFLISVALGGIALLASATSWTRRA